MKSAKSAKTAVRFDFKADPEIVRQYKQLPFAKKKVILNHLRDTLKTTLNIADTIDTGNCQNNAKSHTFSVD